MMNLLKLAAAIATLLPTSCPVSAAVTHDEQIILQPDVHATTSPHAINVAIIGAGAAGASAAYHLANYSSTTHLLPLNITVFERNPYIGGRSTTVNAYESPEFPVELGASIFVEVNQILTTAVQTFNLSTTDRGDDPKGIPGSVLAVWDGKGFAFELTGKYSWWDTARLLYKYGLAPVKTQRLMKSVVGKFLRMYEEPVFPFESLTAAAQEVGLLAVTAATGDEYMRENGITGPFGREVVQASTRVNYAQNLEFIHGLEAMVCMATDGAVAVEGGNWKIFSEMVRASGATVLLHTDVREVKNENGSYTIGYTALETNDTREQSFDAVILASPYQFTNIPSLPHAHIPDEIPYVELHVTLFTSRHLLSPEFFGLKPGQATPQIILTTLPDGEPARPGKESVGRPGFFSLSLLRPVKNPRTNVDEYLYKIFSPEPVNSTFLNPLLGIPAPVSDGDPGEDDVSWIYRKVWYSYPYEVPRVTFEEVKLADNLWYTSGMDSFISTMETNALMGKNVARLVADEWMRKAKRYGSMVENGSGVGDELDV